MIQRFHDSKIQNTMKHLFFLVLLLTSSILYGQNPDLMVTVNGDSIKCKLVRVKANEIQFRIGAGDIIFIDRKEVASYLYHFESDKPVSVKLPPFYAAAMAGASNFGTYEVGNVKIGGTLDVGADLAYFFTAGIGAGLKWNMAFCDVDFGESIVYNETMTFIGPALYGRWGANKLAATLSAGGGLLSWKLSNMKFFNISQNDKTYSSFGGFITAGVNYMVTQHIGVGLNIKSALGTLKDDSGYERKPAGIGASLGINFRF